jgi:hypothetical protein
MFQLRSRSQQLTKTFDNQATVEALTFMHPESRYGTALAARPPDNFTIHDQTMHWSKDVHRLWLDKNINSNSNISAQILLTNFGWNHPDPHVGITFTRSKRSAKLTEGVVNHPWFHPTAWDDFENNNNDTHTQIDKSIRYYVFLDVETCFESNWPKYGQKQIVNFDLDHNRTFRKEKKAVCGFFDDGCSDLDRALAARIFHTPGVKATLVVFDCKGNGQKIHFRHNRTKDSPLALVTTSSTPEQLKDPDMGLPPAAIKPVELTLAQIDDIQTCKAETSRPHLLTFVGNFRSKAREGLRQLNNDKDVLIFHRNALQNHTNGTFEDMLVMSKFAAAPRGDNLFSYRFTEILSAGAIPVIHADGWVLPFRKELVDWKECALHIPEADVSKTLEILAQIDHEKRCQMRKRCYEIYDKYMRTHEGTIAGIIESLEMVAHRRYSIASLNNGIVNTLYI